jgi:transposase
MIDIAQLDPQQLEELGVEQLRELTRALLAHRGRDAHEIAWRDAKIDKLTFELAQLKRLKFDRVSERMDAEQRALFDEAVDGDIAAIDEQLAALQATLPPKTDDDKKTPKRAALPERLPRREVRHELENTTCSCGCALKRVGEDISEKLDYTPGVFIFGVDPAAVPSRKGHQGSGRGNAIATSDRARRPGCQEPA